MGYLAAQGFGKNKMGKLVGMWLDLSKQAVCEDIHSQEMCTRG